MKQLSDVIACVHDHGLFAVPFARKLAEHCKQVYVTTPWETGFSTINAAILGDGFPDIKRVDDVWAVKNDADMFCFPDIQHSGLQLELESQGFPVWGARRGDQQELNRELFLKTLKRVGLEIPPHVILIGLDALGEYLQDAEDCYIKISLYRGSFETIHWRSWLLDKSLFALWRVKFGPAGDHLRFLVFENIETPLEIGVDTYCVDGHWPTLMLHGIEAKDEAYFSAVTRSGAMPEQIREVIDAFSPVLAKSRYRSQFSAEVRVKDGIGYFTDPTCRGGLPSTASQLEIWSNFADIVWHGANGVLLEPEPAAMFTAEAILTMKGDKQLWGETILPKSLQQWVKPAYCCQIDGKLCFPPDDSHGNAVGWLVALGNTPRETIARINEYADQLPDGVTANTKCLANVLKEIHEEEDAGIEFSDHAIPEPSIAIDT